MKIVHNNKFKKFLQLPMVMLISSNLLLLSNCNSAFNSTIQFANFESYMSQDLIDDLSHKYNIQFPYYTTNEVIETKFANYYDIAIPSCYQMLVLQQKDMLEKIDWSLFDIKGVENAEDAKAIFNKELIDDVNKWVKDWTADPKHNFKEPINNILDYCVPYFAQSLMFAYKGPSQTFYHHDKQPISGENENITWDDIFYTFSPSSPIADFFKPQRNQCCAMLDDCRSIYDVARIIDTNNETNEPNLELTLEDAKKTYDCITKYFENYVGNSWIQIQTDSGNIATNLSNHNGGYLGAITWSGDILYAAMGAGEFDPWDAKNLHIVKPLGGATLNEVDTIVINKQSKKDKNSIYNIIKQVALDGCQVNEKELFAKNEKDQYKYWTIRNFDAIGYTPVLKNIYESIIGDSCPYWEDIEDEATKEMYKKIIENEKGQTRLFGKPLTDLQNSNIHWAWLESKEKF